MHREWIAMHARFLYILWFREHCIIFTWKNIHHADGRRIYDGKHSSIYGLENSCLNQFSNQTAFYSVCGWFGEFMFKILGTNSIPINICERVSRNRAKLTLRWLIKISMVSAAMTENLWNSKFDRFQLVGSTIVHWTKIRDRNSWKPRSNECTFMRRFVCLVGQRTALKIGR